MDLTPSAPARQLAEALNEFMDTSVIPAEAAAERWAATAPAGHEPPALADLKAEARRQGLWNLGISSISGLSNLDYCYIAEIAGRSPEFGPAAINGAAPDSVNMTMLDAVVTDTQRKLFLKPLLEDQHRSAFAMTEPDVASSDASNINTRIEVRGDDFVLNGRKWYITGAANPRCKVFFVLGCTNPKGGLHARHSVVAVPVDTPGVTVRRTLPVFGYDGDQAEVTFDNVVVPRDYLLGDFNGGFAVAQTRLAAARLQHCMRMIGLAERAFAMTCERAGHRVVQGELLAVKGMFRSDLADSRMQLNQARLMVLYTAALVDAHGAKAARSEISQIKVITMRMALAVIGRAISVHGAAGLSDDLPLARWWAHARGLHIADGPEETHLEVIARRELKAYAVGALAVA